MFVTYQVNTMMVSDAIKMATNLAKASGYKNIVVSRTLQSGPGSWDVILVVS